MEMNSKQFLQFLEFMMKNQSKGKKPPTAKEELEEFNIIPEHKALGEFLKGNLEPKDRLYKQARYNILTYIIKCVEEDPERGDYYSPENMALLKEAGRMLNEEGGINSMRDNLVWSFIPKRYHREIENEWGGIGEWLA